MKEKHIKTVQKILIGIISVSTLISLFLIISLFLGCTNHAYKVVATDVNRSPRNLIILANVCAQIAHNEPVKKSTSDTVIVERLDTVQNQALMQTIDYYLRYMAEHCKEVDTAKLRALFLSELKPCVNKVRTEHIHDTVFTPDPENGFKLVAMQGEGREKDKTIDKQANQIEALKTTVKEKEAIIQNYGFKKWMGWATLGLVISGWLFVKIYIKK